LRKLSILISFILLTSPLAITKANAATPKLGGACSKVGSFGDTPKVRFVCVKSGKKLVWGVRKGPSTPSSTPQPTKSSVPAKVEFKAPIPITLPIATSSDANAITFTNIMDHIVDIPKVAWQKVQDVIAGNPAVIVPHDIFVGPNTQMTLTGGMAQAESIFARSTRLWSGFSQTKYDSIYIFNITDEPWAAQKFHDLAAMKNYTAELTGGFANVIRQACTQPSQTPGGYASQIPLASSCHGASAGPITESDDSAEEFGEGDLQHPDTYGGIFGHEYIHTVQAAQWIGNCKQHNQDNGCSRGGLGQMFTRCWINEGQPQSIGLMVAATDYQSYIAMRSNGKDSSQHVTDYSEASLKHYLFDQSAPSCYQNGALYQLGYGPGAMATEILTAVAGPQSTMALYALGADGQDFPTAFQNVYGLSWSDGSTLLAKVLAAEYARCRDDACKD